VCFNNLSYLLWLHGQKQAEAAAAAAAAAADGTEKNDDEHASSSALLEIATKQPQSKAAKSKKVNGRLLYKCSISALPEP